MGNEHRVVSVLRCAVAAFHGVPVDVVLNFLVNKLTRLENGCKLLSPLVEPCTISAMLENDTIPEDDEALAVYGVTHPNRIGLRPVLLSALLRCDRRWNLSEIDLFPAPDRRSELRGAYG